MLKCSLTRRTPRQHLGVLPAYEASSEAGEQLATDWMALCNISGYGYREVPWL